MSHLVTHESTNPARPCLTSEIERDLVYSWWYGRWRSIRQLFFPLCLQALPHTVLSKLVLTRAFNFLPTYHTGKEETGKDCSFWLYFNIFNDIFARYSHLVTHESTNPARPCLTSEIERDLVYSWWYGRWRSILFGIFPLYFLYCHYSMSLFHSVSKM